MKDISSYRQLCEKYFYLVEHYVNKYNLSEDCAGDLAVILCDAVQKYVEQDFVTPMATYIHGRLEHYASKQTKFGANKATETIDEGAIYYLEEMSQYKECFLRNFWDIIEEFIMPRELYVLQLRFVQNLSLEEVCTCIGVTSVRVRQIEKKAIRKLQRGLQKESFEEFI